MIKNYEKFSNSNLFIEKNFDTNLIKCEFETTKIDQQMIFSNFFISILLFHFFYLIESSLKNLAPIFCSICEEITVPFVILVESLNVVSSAFHSFLCVQLKCSQVNDYNSSDVNERGVEKRF